MAKFVTVDAKWLPPPTRGGSKKSQPMTANAVPAERGVSVIIEGINEYAHGLRGEARVIMNEVGAEIHKDAVNNVTGPAGMWVYTGKLRQSVKPQKDGDDGIKIVMGGPGAPYAPFFEYGTRSGAPSLKAIENWMRRKNIVPRVAMWEGSEKAAYRASAWLIRKKIMRTGIPATPSLFPAFEAHRQQFIDKIKALLGA